MYRICRSIVVLVTLWWANSANAQQQIVDVQVKGELRRVAESLILSTVGL